MYLKRVAFKALEFQTEEDRRMKRNKIYTKNHMYRRKLRLLFGSWRGVSHQWFKERINKEAVIYETTKRTELLVRWDSEVETLKLYMAQLQEKIRVEVHAREDLAKTYE